MTVLSLSTVHTVLLAWLAIVVHTVLLAWLANVVHTVLLTWLAIVVHTVLLAWLAIVVHTVLLAWLAIVVHTVLLAWLAIAVSFDINSNNQTVQVKMVSMCLVKPIIMRSALSLRSFPNVAIETVPMSF